MVQEAVRLFARAQHSRTQSETDANAHSSRSHAIFTIKIVKVPLIDDRVFEVCPRVPGSGHAARKVPSHS